MEQFHCHNLNLQMVCNYADFKAYYFTNEGPNFSIKSFSRLQNNTEQFVKFKIWCFLSDENSYSIQNVVNNDSKRVQIEHLITLEIITEEIGSNCDGTNEVPLLVNVVPAKTGHKFVFKIAARYYEGVRYREHAKTGGVVLRCQTFRTVQPSGAKCRHVVKVINVTGNPKDSVGYWRRESWRVIAGKGLCCTHQCPGYSRQEIVAKLTAEQTQYSQGIRRKSSHYKAISSNSLPTVERPPLPISAPQRITEITEIDPTEVTQRPYYKQEVNDT